MKQIRKYLSRVSRYLPIIFRFFYNAGIFPNFVCSIQISNSFVEPFFQFSSKPILSRFLNQEVIHCFIAFYMSIRSLKSYFLTSISISFKPKLWIVKGIPPLWSICPVSSLWFSPHRRQVRRLFLKKSKQNPAAILRWFGHETLK